MKNIDLFVILIFVIVCVICSTGAYSMGHDAAEREQFFRFTAVHDQLVLERERLEVEELRNKTHPCQPEK